MYKNYKFTDYYKNHLFYQKNICHVLFCGGEWRKKLIETAKDA